MRAYPSDASDSGNITTRFIERHTECRKCGESIESDEDDPTCLHCEMLELIKMSIEPLSVSQLEELNRYINDKYYREGIK